MDAVQIYPLTPLKVLFIRLALWPALVISVLSFFSVPVLLHSIYGRPGLLIGLVSLFGAASLLQIVWWVIRACGSPAIEAKTRF